ncbi:MAG: hypothetical protein ABFD89_04205 [Bryobacteraceae bacterium]
MSEGRSVAESVGSLFEKGRFVRESGIRIVEVRPGYGRTQMDVEARHLNAAGPAPEYTKKWPAPVGAAADADTSGFLGRKPQK